jgi:hypothetical protein
VTKTVNILYIDRRDRIKLILGRKKWIVRRKLNKYTVIKNVIICEISSSRGGEYDVQNCLLGCTAVILHGSTSQKTILNVIIIHE